MKVTLFSLRRLSLLLVAPALGACATVLPAAPADTPAHTASPPAHALALMKPCANTADAYPWRLTDTWDDGADPYLPEMRFEDGGVVAYAYAGYAYDNGRWTLAGETFSIDMNNHHTDYAGVFDGTSGSGTIANVDGDTGKWTLARACEG